MESVSRIDTARLRALLEEWKTLEGYGDATSRDKKRTLLMSYKASLPGLLDEIDRLRAALAAIIAIIRTRRTISKSRKGSHARR